MKPLPMPLRIAAGLVATAIEEAQALPRKLIELPLTAVSQALQVSMRVQQRITELAIKGDRALGTLRPVPETPSWARFDEDEVPHLPTNGLATSRMADVPSWPAARAAPRRVTQVRVVPEPESEVPAPRGPARSESAATANGVPAGRESAAGVAGEPDAKSAAKAPKPGAAEPAGAPGPTSTASGPAGLEEYERWSLPQLRGRFRKLTLEQLQALLGWETAHQDRPPYVTMLSNRIASITGR